MSEKAHVIAADRPSVEELRVEKLLAFFGVSYDKSGLDEFWTTGRNRPHHPAGCRVIASSVDLLRLLAAVQHDGEGLRRWPEEVHSVFVLGGGDAEAIGRLMEFLGGGVSVHPRKQGQDGCRWTISSAVDGFGGALSGLDVLPSERATGPGYVAEIRENQAVPLISRSGEVMLLMLQWHGVPIYLSLAENIVDLDDELDTPNFDIRDHFFSAVPIVLYLRSAFPSAAWAPPEAGACLIIDDPLLKPRYGCLRYRLLLDLMERYNFSTNIAFIPWNWRRSDSETVDLFEQNPKRLSLSIHGCDHTAGEFGKDEAEQLRAMTVTALNRMAAHENQTGLGYGRIMVFPQGVFSEAAMRELKHANFIAAVNTEVACCGRSNLRIKISDVWDTAVRSYADYPLYTRRYPAQRVENFAFDIILGKPCLVVIHHDFCRDKFRHLVEFIQRLNSLQTKLVWRSLDEVVRRSYRWREVSPGLREIEMYGGEIRVENPSLQTQRFRIRRRERDSAAVTEFHIGPKRIWSETDNEYRMFEISVPSGNSVLISARVATRTKLGSNGQVQSSWKTGLRRYLSELRDNYVVPAKSRLAVFWRRA